MKRISGPIPVTGSHWWMSNSTFYRRSQTIFLRFRSINPKSCLWRGFSSRNLPNKYYYVVPAPSTVSITTFEIETMNDDENVAVSVLLGMKQSVVSSAIDRVQKANTGVVNDHQLFLISAPNANCVTKNRKRSNTKHSKVKQNIKRSDCISTYPQSVLSRKRATKVKSDVRAKKPKLISPVSVMDTINGQPQHSNTEKTKMVYESLLPMLSESFKSSDLPLMNMLSPKSTLQPLNMETSHRSVMPNEDATVNGTEQANSHFNTPFFRQQMQEQQNTQLLTQDIVAALLTAEIQKMNVLVNAQQKELYTSNHVSNYIAAALSHPVSITPGLASSLSRSVTSPLQGKVPTSEENWVPISVSSPWADSIHSISPGLDNDFYTNHNMGGMTNALLLNLLQQATAPNSFA